jgi:putative inorganic carbon (HCO3(-)) transporter
MRDAVIVLMLVGVIPAILRRPWLGIVAWVVVSVLNPHRMAYGFSHDLPTALIIASVTMLAIPFAKEEKRLPLNSPTVMLLLCTVWMCLSTLGALHPDLAYLQWKKVMKIMFMTFVGIWLLHSRLQMHALLWAIVASLAFYGVKGGVFALLTGGEFRVYGPPESEVADNNSIAFALVMVLPLMSYLAGSVQGRWVRLNRWGWHAAMAFSALAVLASHSRGALLALGAMTAFLWAKSKQRLRLGLVIVVAAPMLIGFMPQEWWDRMATIGTYDQDASAQGRINAWKMAFNLANDHPVLGGGFQIYESDVFARWAPDPDDVHAAHSIYFAALGEHGYVGLLLFVTLWIVAWRTATAVIRICRGRDTLDWAAKLARMLQVSIVGYAVGGAFLSVLYFDVPYYLIVCLSMLREIAEREASALPAAPATASSALAVGSGVGFAASRQSNHNSVLGQPAGRNSINDPGRASGP